MAPDTVVWLFFNLVNFMKTRRKCREAAIQVLYAYDSCGFYSQEVFDSYLNRFASSASSEDNFATAPDSGFDGIGFLKSLVDGVARHQEFIDAQITAASRNWAIARMPRVDRNILRLAVFELGFCADIPQNVAINEAIELAKKFGSEESAQFVNGVIDRIAQVFAANPEILSLAAELEVTSATPDNKSAVNE